MVVNRRPLDRAACARQSAPFCRPAQKPVPPRMPAAQSGSGPSVKRDRLTLDVSVTVLSAAYAPRDSAERSRLPARDTDDQVRHACGPTPRDSRA
jgi:hypothetical protein